MTYIRKNRRSTKSKKRKANDNDNNNSQKKRRQGVGSDLLDEYGEMENDDAIMDRLEASVGELL